MGAANAMKLAALKFKSLYDISLSLNMVLVCFKNGRESLKYFYKKQILLDMSGFLISILFAFGP